MLPSAGRWQDGGSAVAEAVNAKRVIAANTLELNDNNSGCLREMFRIISDIAETE